MANPAPAGPLPAPKNEWTTFGLVAGFGGIGGLGYAFLTWFHGGNFPTSTIFKLGTPGYCAAAFFLGAIAAVASVYMVAQIDLQNRPRLAAACLVYGMGFLPVTETLMSRLQSGQSSSTDTQAKGKAEKPTSPNKVPVLSADAPEEVTPTPPPH